MKRFAPFAFAVIGLSVWVGDAQAIPAFARKYKVQCSACHDPWPSLNATGRVFKENGYRFNRNERPGFMNWDQAVPVTAVLEARPYEKAQTGKKTLRALHEAELMIAGTMGLNYSGFAELEAEDDAGKGFEVTLANAAIGYHYSPAVNFQFSWAPVTWSDPYDSFSDARRMTRNRQSVINQPFGGADNGGVLRDNRQNMSLYGRPVENIFYSLSYSGVKGDPVAEDGDMVTGRLAVDVASGSMIGVTAMSGTCEMNPNSFVTNCAVARSFSRVAIDALIEYAGWRFQGALLEAKDDVINATPPPDTNEHKNRAIFVQGRYLFSVNGQPTWMPLLRYDTYEQNDGKDEFKAVTMHVSRYLTENSRAFAEYIDINKPRGQKDDSIVTLQGEVAF